jgi:quercetin dioxygenase-like cupin family protein
MPFVLPRELTPNELKPGWVARFFHSDHMTFSYAEVTTGSSVHRHHHREEEVWNIIEGDVEFTLGDETRTVRAGDAVVVPSEVGHAATAISSFRAIIVDFPIRDSVAGVPQSRSTWRSWWVGSRPRRRNTRISFVAN